MAQSKKNMQMNEDLSWVLQGVRLTEKTAIQSGDRVYTFNVHKDANKIQIKKAVQQYYNVQPEKVRVMINKPERILGRNRRGGMTKAFKKALVYLPEGQNIALA
ncbi:MAG: 50S ribosomal protein L23 [Candidatus Pacebacteria bacterium]|nr:50S ribosomal protein L23 [Candidatus Paceibacterota bacterium]MCD8508121.1 50S ribosomal protein L23 [Candidatus Paceibacterota bacterium]MCD8527912.1 50S ribosomal protein L23 [Candidatus Paceibacterota bacterium]MCD8563757.1 50S ribosomal protein L23 [Candidatus Paceibacterota bacterium]